MTNPSRWHILLSTLRKHKGSLMTKLKQCTITIPNRNASLFPLFFELANNETTLVANNVSLSVTSEYQGDSGTRFHYTFPVFEHNGMKVVGYTDFRGCMSRDLTINTGYNIFSTLENGVTEFFDISEIGEDNTKICAICGEEHNHRDEMFILEKEDGSRAIAHGSCVNNNFDNGLMASRLYRLFAYGYQDDIDLLDSDNTLDRNSFYNEDTSMVTIFTKAIIFIDEMKKKGLHNKDDSYNASFLTFHYPEHLVKNEDIKKQAKNAFFMVMKKYGITKDFSVDNMFTISPHDVCGLAQKHIEYIEAKDQDLTLGRHKDGVLHVGDSIIMKGEVSRMSNTFINIKKAVKVEITSTPNHVFEIRGYGFKFDILDLNDTIALSGTVVEHSYSRLDDMHTTVLEDIEIFEIDKVEDRKDAVSVGGKLRFSNIPPCR